MRSQKLDRKDSIQTSQISSRGLPATVLIVLVTMVCTLSLPGLAKADDEFRPWLDADFGFTVTPRGVAADFSHCGNWLVYANSNPGDNVITTQAIMVNVIDSSADNPAEWERVATLPLQSPFFALPVQAGKVAWHPEHDAFAVTHSSANDDGDGVAFFDASDPDPNSWIQVQYGDISLYPRPEGTSLSFTDDGAYLAVGIGISPIQSEFNLGWEVFDTSDPNPANWEFADVLQVISGGDEAGGSPRDSAFSPDGDRLVLVHHTEQDGNSDQHITVINSSGDEWFALFTQPNVGGPANGVDFHPSGQWFAVAYDGGVRLFETATMDQVSAFSVDIGGSGVSARFSPDGNVLAVGYFASIGDEGVRWIDTSSSNPADWARDSSIGPTNQPSSSRDISFSPDGEHVAMAHRLGSFASVGRRAQSPSVPRDVSASYVEGSFDSFLEQGEIEVTWTEPSFDGGGSIDGYELASIDNAFDTVLIDSELRAVTVTFDYTALADAGSVPIELAAVGQADLQGPGAEAAAALPSVPGTISGLVIVGVEVDGDIASWQFAWDAPADNGGAPLTGYRVRTELAGGGQNMFEVEVEAIEVDFGLDGGQISVAAENEFGEGDRVSMTVPALTEPVLSDAPDFSSAGSSSASLFEITVDIDEVTSWGTVNGSEAGPGEYVFTYPGANGPITVIEPAGAGAAEISAILAIPGAELVAGQTVQVKARNEFGLASAAQSTTMPVFAASINGLSGLVASQPSWNDDAQAYISNLTWAEYRPFEGNDSALALLGGGDQPGGTVTVVVTNSPPVTGTSGAGNIDVILDNAEAPEFGDAVTQVRIDGLGDGELASGEVSIGIPSVAVPQAPMVSVSNPRFVGSTLLQDLLIEHSGEHSAPIVDAEAVSADDGVTINLDADGEKPILSGDLAVDLSVVDYQNPEIGSTHPGALVALVDAAGVVGDSQLAEAAAVPDPAPVSISDDNVTFDNGQATISLVIEISDISSAGPTESFEITVGGESVSVESVEGSAENPTVSVTTPASELVFATEVTISRTSITGAGSESVSVMIEGLGDEVFYDDFESS